MEKEFYTINDAARYLGISDMFIRQSAQSGYVKVIAISKSRLGRKVGIPMDPVRVIEREELERFAEHPAFKRSKRIYDLRKLL